MRVRVEGEGDGECECECECECEGEREGEREGWGLHHRVEQRGHGELQPLPRVVAQVDAQRSEHRAHAVALLGVEQLAGARGGRVGEGVGGVGEGAGGVWGGLEA